MAHALVRAASRLVSTPETSLPVKFPLWRSTAKNIVFLWPKNLNSDRKENGATVLAYYNEGLFSKLGRKWVLFGDLRTEFLTEAEIAKSVTR